MIVLISELFGASYKQAENHLDYLVMSTQLPLLKQGGVLCLLDQQQLTALQSQPKNCFEPCIMVLPRGKRDKIGCSQQSSRDADQASTRRYRYGV